MNTPEIVNATVDDMPVLTEYFIPVYQYKGDGVVWYSGSIQRSKLEAEKYIQDYGSEYKAVKIVKVILPNN